MSEEEKFEQNIVNDYESHKGCAMQVIGFCVGFIVTTLLLFIFTSCTTTKVVTEYRDSIQYVAHYDTTIIHIKDSAERYVSNDTIYLTKWKSKEVITIKYDTISDKQVIREPYEVVVTKDKVPSWCWWLLAIAVAFVGYKIVRIVIKIYTKGGV